MSAEYGVPHAQNVFHLCLQICYQRNKDYYRSNEKMSHISLVDTLFLPTETGAMTTWTFLRAQSNDSPLHFHSPPIPIPINLGKKSINLGQTNILPRYPDDMSINIGHMRVRAGAMYVQSREKVFANLAKQHPDRAYVQYLSYSSQSQHSPFWRQLVRNKAY